MVRYKNRYIVTEFSLHGKPGIISKKSLRQLIEVAIHRLHGDFGIGMVGYGLDVKYLNPDTRICLIRARHGAHKFVGSALPFIQQPVRFRTLSVKATILKSYKFIKSYQIRQLEKFLKTKGSDQKLNANDQNLLNSLKDFVELNQLEAVEKSQN